MTSTTSADEIAKALGIDEIDPEVDEQPQNFNVAPTQPVLVVAGHKGVRRLETMRWGLVPFFAKDISIGSRLINARAEAVVDKPSYRRAFVKRRCLFPIDGFYEWQKVKSGKQPWYFTLRDDSPLALAGLWEVWHDPELPEDAPPLFSCTIITTEANKDMAEFHNRMPLALEARDWDAWLDVEGVGKDEAVALLRQPKAGRLAARKISTAVNNVRNNGPELIAPVDD